MSFRATHALVAAGFINKGPRFRQNIYANVSDFVEHILKGSVEAGTYYQEELMNGNRRVDQKRP